MKRNANYGSLFVFCFFCFILVSEGNPFYNLKQNILTMTDETVVETVVEGSRSVKKSAGSGCVPSASKENQHKKLSDTVVWRDQPPTTYCVKVNFPALAKLVRDGYYESLPFTAGGYSWTYILYPYGNVKDGAKHGQLSYYVRIDNSSLINDPKDVYAEVKFFTYHTRLNKFHVVGGPGPRKFNLFKREYGLYGYFMTADILNPYYGYFFDGEHVAFGVDVFVTPTFKDWELFSYDQTVSDPIYTWKLTGFSSLYSDSYTSKPFPSGGRTWVLKVYPYGDGSGKGNSLSLYLFSKSDRKEYVKAKLRVLNRIKSNHVEKQVDGWPSVTINNGWGFEKFIPIAVFTDPSKGYVVNDAFSIEVEILALSKTDRYPMA